MSYLLTSLKLTLVYTEYAVVLTYNSNSTTAFGVYVTCVMNVPNCEAFLLTVVAGLDQQFTSSTAELSDILEFCTKTMVNFSSLILVPVPMHVNENISGKLEIFQR